MSEQDNVEDEVGSSHGHSLGLSTAVEAEYITKSSPNQSRRRAFSFASSSKGSLFVRSWPQAGVGLRRGFLIGRRGGPSTPAPCWKVSDNSIASFQRYHHPFHLKHDHIVEGLHISARKLAAALWELHKLPCSRLEENLGQEPQDNNTNASSTKKPSTMNGQPLSPASSCVSMGSYMKPPVYVKLGDHGKIHTRLERRKGQQAMPATAASKKKIIGKEGATSPSKSMVPSSRDAFSNLSCRPTTTSELLNVLNHVWSLEEQQASSMSLVGTLRMELEDAQAQLQELLSNESLHRKGVENLSKKIVEERALMQGQQEQIIREAVESVNQELENERRSKLKLEMLHKKLAREFRDTKKSVGRAMEELARERKARQLMEEVCDELSREIGQDKSRVEELKLESVKVREEVEEERKMLQMAEVWREERVQMKLMEAKLELEEKNTALDKMRGQLEGFLETKRTSDSKDAQGSMTSDERQVGQPSSVEVVVGRNLLEPFHSKDQRGLMSGRNSVDSSGGHGVKQSMWTSNSDDDDLHSIEISCDLLAKAATSERGLHSFQQRTTKYQERRQRLDEQMLVVNSLEPEGVDRSRSTRRERIGRQEAEVEEVAPVGVLKGYQWIGHNVVEGREKTKWRRQEQQHEGQGESSNSRQIDTEDSQSRVSVSPKVMVRSISENIMRAALVSVEKKASKSCEWQQQLNIDGRWHPSLVDGPAFYGSNKVSSPTRMWNNHMPAPDFESKPSSEAVYDCNSLKTKLLEAKLEGQQAEQKKAGMSLNGFFTA